MYSVLFSSNPKQKSSTVILWCSCRPRRPKYWDKSHQTVWTRNCGLPFLSFFFSHCSFSSPCWAACLCLVAARRAFPSRTCFDLLNSLSRIIKCLYSLTVRYRSRAVTITRRLPGSKSSRVSYELLRKTPPEFSSRPPVRTFQYFCHSPFEKPKTSRLSQLFVLCWVFLFLAFSFKL